MAQSLPYIYDCKLAELSLKHAAALVPREYQIAWAWFQQMEGKTIPVLPMGEHAPNNVPVKLAAQRGIHTPASSTLSSGWTGERQYALSIHSSKKSHYDDRDVIRRTDGTWLFDYSEQRTEEGRKSTWDHNASLMHCLEDGVPVGVMVGHSGGHSGGGYEVLGLGFVERYNSHNGTFTIHGPVNPVTEAEQVFYAIADNELSSEEKARLDELKQLHLTDEDERKRVFIRSVRRERQAQFRAMVYAAYGGKCAISGTGLPDVLQAAHIDNYRGAKSQIVRNGLLLRADLHLLYDANLLGIEPETHEIRLAEKVVVEPYVSLLEGAKLTMPSDLSLAPDDDLLDIHYRQFVLQNRVA